MEYVNLITGDKKYSEGYASFIREEDALLALTTAGKKWNCELAEQKRPEGNIKPNRVLKHEMKNCNRWIREGSFKEHIKCCHLLHKREVEIGDPLGKRRPVDDRDIVYD